MASTMQAVTAPRFTDPSGYELSSVPRPTISDDKDVLIQVRAASINPVDVMKASGVFKLAINENFPYKIGYDCSGVVAEIGRGVTEFQVGDEVYVRLPEASRGSWSEYAMCSEYFVSRRPRNISFEEAASLPLAAMTAFQALSRYQGGLSGKTVFIPAGLGGTGAYACQLAKNVFKAGKVITTVSTSKMDKVPQLLGEGTVDQVIDYTKNDPLKAIPRGSVDFIFDTMGQAMSFLPLMAPQGHIVSISTQPGGAQLQQSSVMRRPDNPQLPWIPRLILDGMDMYRRTRARWWGVTYEYMFIDPNGKDLKALAEYVEQGRIVPVVGEVVELKDLERSDSPKTINSILEAVLCTCEDSHDLIG